MDHLDSDQIVLLALGERTERGEDAGDRSIANLGDGPRLHLQDCAECRRELQQLTRTVELAREAGELGLQAPVVLPPSIWNGIAAELGIGGAPDIRPGADLPGQRGAANALDRAPVRRTAARRADGGTHRAPGREPSGDTAPPEVPARRRSWRRGLLAAAVVVAVGAGIGLGVIITQRESPSVAVQSEAVLKAMPAGPPTAHGTATITATPDGLTLNVAARQLPLRQGYYEVWLYDPTADQMVAVGTLGQAGDGVWTLASTIDLRSYSIVDVSAQDFDGNPAHKDSVLQGPLTQ